MSRPARWPKAMASDRPCTSPAIAIWLTIFASWPAPLSPSSVTARAKAAITGLTAIEGGRVAAAHHRQRAVLRAGLAAGDRARR